MGTIAIESGELRILAGRFPIVRYNGQAVLSPQKLVTWVESDPKMRGMIALFGYFV